jgi:hypothetical protein
VGLVAADLHDLAVERGTLPAQHRAQRLDGLADGRQRLVEPLPDHRLTMTSEDAPMPSVNRPLRQLRERDRAHPERRRGPRLGRDHGDAELEVGGDRQRPERGEGVRALDLGGPAAGEPASFGLAGDVDARSGRRRRSGAG